MAHPDRKAVDNMKKSNEHELRKYVGDLGALYGIRAYTMTDGQANGVRAFDLQNGSGISLTVLQDRGLDIPFLRFKGHNIGFYSKAGITAPGLYQEEGVRGFLKRFNGGLLTTCGMTYAGAACKDGDRELGLHGPFSNTPAEMVCAETTYENDQAVLRIAGQVREACVFQENLRMTREIRLETEQNIVHLTDTVENLGFDEQPLMLVYHVNFGYPMLDAGAKIYFSTRNMKPRDAEAEQYKTDYATMEKPVIDKAEQCFFHTDSEKPEDAFAMLVNEKLGIASILHYDERQLPLLCEWKCMRAGDYALGLEPTTAGVMGRVAVKQAGNLPMLKPGESKTLRISLRLTDDKSEIEKYIEMTK